MHSDLTWYGDAAFRTAVIEKEHALNVRISRHSFLWHTIERTRGTRGTRDWRTTDAVVAELAARGIEPLLVIYGSPAWATGLSPSTAESHLYVPQDSAAFRTWVAEYAAFIREAARRYKGQVTKWEIGNEPNEHYFWKPAPNLEQYVAWYTALYAAIKAEDPTADVALGGLAGLSAGNRAAGDITGQAFLQGLYDRGVYPDIVAIHPYAGAQQAPDVTIRYENNFTDIAKIRALMVANGQGSKPIWVTEWGWKAAHVGEATQAAYVAKSLAMLAREYPYVTVATYFCNFDRGRYSQGLYTTDFRLREAGQRFRDFAQVR